MKIVITEHRNVARKHRSLIGSLLVIEDQPTRNFVFARRGMDFLFNGPDVESLMYHGLRGIYCIYPYGLGVAQRSPTDDTLDIAQLLFWLFWGIVILNLEETRLQYNVAFTCPHAWSQLSLAQIP